MHIPVLEKEAIEFLNIKDEGIYVDATAGCGGHSKKILQKLKKGILVVIDRDISAIEICKKNLSQSNSKVEFKRGNFRDLDKILDEIKIKEIDGILFDLGISSLQLADKERGFSFLENGRLDMRMDISQKKDAYFVVNKYSEENLRKVIFEYGQERWAKNIARKIVAERKKKPIETTAELSSIVKSSIPRRYWGKIHPATRTFQAIRIEVNDELSSIEEGVKKAVLLLKEGGRIVVISFHSGEDRIVKNIFYNFAKEGILNILTRKVIKPTEEEIKANPHSRSARMRVGERRDIYASNSKTTNV